MGTGCVFTDIQLLLDFVIIDSYRICTICDMSLSCHKFGLLTSRERIRDQVAGTLPDSCFTLVSKPHWFPGPLLLYRTTFLYPAEQSRNVPPYTNALLSVSTDKSWSGHILSLFFRCFPFSPSTCSESASYACFNQTPGREPDRRPCAGAPRAPRARPGPCLGTGTRPG